MDDMETLFSKKQSCTKQPEPSHFAPLPPSGMPIWRYVSLAKLLALLQTQAVFLCRADLFDDVFEGTFTEGSIRDHMIKWGAKFPSDLVTMARWIPCRSFVSCWHVSEIESAALWKIYAGSDGACAIRSTIGALTEAFPETLESGDDMLISQEVRMVQYIDYRTAHPYLNNLAGPLCYKRQAFTFEQEVRVIRQELPTSVTKDRPNGRAILVGDPPDETGREIAVDLERLIAAIYLAPSSPSWMLPTIKETMKRFGVGSIQCRQSSLDELPEFGRLG